MDETVAERSCLHELGLAQVAVLGHIEELLAGCVLLTLGVRGWQAATSILNGVLLFGT